jgi:aldose sugar dehydrogenase
MAEMPKIIEVGGQPITLAFSANGRAFFSERLTGNLWEIIDKDNFRLVRHFPIVPAVGHHEVGLLGIALDPDFDKNGYIYCFYTSGEILATAKNKVVRISDKTDDELTLVENIPAQAIHNGGIVAIGPDKKLYIGVGVANEVMKKSQDISFLGGKVLRVNLDGSIPEDNPFPGSPVYSYGHRNVFGMAFHPGSGKLYVSDVGPEKNDEINIVEAGGNYGWPEVTGAVKDDRFIDPIISYTPTITPTQNLFHDGYLYFGGYNEGTVHRLKLDESGQKVLADDIVYEGKPFGVIGVFVDTSNNFYVATSNNIAKFIPKTK